MSFYIKDIWIFSNSQAVIKRVQKSSLEAGQTHIQAIED